MARREEEEQVRALFIVAFAVVVSLILIAMLHQNTRNFLIQRQDQQHLI